MAKTLLSEKLKSSREEQKIPQRKVASFLDIDTGTYSKIENGLFSPKREQVLKLAEYLNIDSNKLINIWLADKVYLIFDEDDDVRAVLSVVKEEIEPYGKKEK